MFCTGDTGGGFAEILIKTRPRMLITEVTYPNAQESLARSARHMTPKLLEEELRPLAGTESAPQTVLAIHMNPSMEGAIRGELALVAKDLNIPITTAYEGLVFEL